MGSLFALLQDVTTVTGFIQSLRKNPFLTLTVILILLFLTGAAVNATVKTVNTFSQSTKTVSHFYSPPKIPPQRANDGTFIGLTPDLEGQKRLLESQKRNQKLADDAHDINNNGGSYEDVFNLLNQINVR